RIKVRSLAVDVDRLSVKPEARSRLSDSIETALRVGGGVARFAFAAGDEPALSDSFRCTSCGSELGESTLAALSFASPRGACELCRGLGERARFDPARVVPDTSLSLRDGAIAPWGAKDGRYYGRMLEALHAALRVDLDKPFRALPARTRERILHGTE